ncbi:MAG: acylphosphatase [Pseudomonadota bacterium]
MSERITLRASITGRVQGVGFRDWTRDNAHRLGLSGWVQNEGDGSVTAVFSGPTAVVDEMLSRCRDGPPWARVDNIAVDILDDAPHGPFQKRVAY